MVHYPLDMNAKVLAGEEKQIQRKRYFLDPLPDSSPEDVRREHLAHLLLLGLKAVKSKKKEHSDL